MAVSTSSRKLKERKNQKKVIARLAEANILKSFWCKECWSYIMEDKKRKKSIFLYIYFCRTCIFYILSEVKLFLGGRGRPLKSRVFYALPLFGLNPKNPKDPRILISKATDLQNV